MTKKTTTANLILNGIGAPIASIKFDSTEMSEKEVRSEISKQFCEMFTFEFNEEVEPEGKCTK